MTEPYMQPSGFACLARIVVAILRGADGNNHVLAFVITEDDHRSRLLDLKGNRPLELVPDILRSTIFT